MSRILLATWDGGGNLAPVLALAAELQRRGHAVEVMSHPSSRRTVEEAGVTFRAYGRGPDWDAGAPSSNLKLVSVFAGRGLGRDVLDRAEKARADVVVVDCMLFGVMRVLRRAHRPYVALEHLCDGFLRQAAKGPLGVVLRLRGTPVVTSLDAAAARVALTVPQLDHGYGDVTHVGPVLPGAVQPTAPAEPTVLISLSTYGYPGLVELWQSLLDAAGRAGVRVVATLGSRVDPADLRVPANVEVHGFADHAELMRECSLVVSHGGHGTTVAALAHGLPVLVVPLADKGDQPFMGASVERVGVGRMLPRSSSSAELVAAMLDLLAPGPHRTAAARLGEEIRAHDGGAGAADAIETEVRAVAERR